MDALARPDHRRPLPVGQPEQAVHPDAGGVDHVPGADLVLVAGEVVTHPGAADPCSVAVPQQPDHLGVGERERPEPACRLGHGEHQPRVVGRRVAVHVGVAQPAALQRRRPADGVVGVDPLVPPDAPHPGQHVVGGEADAEQPASRGVRPHRVEEVHRPDEMRGQAHQRLPLGDALVHQPDLVVLQVAQPAVDQLAGLAAGAAGQVAAVDDGHAEPPAGRVQRDAGPGRAHPDDQHVQLPAGRLGHLGGAVDDGERAGAHRASLADQAGAPTASRAASSRFSGESRLQRSARSISVSGSRGRAGTRSS